MKYASSTGGFYLPAIHGTNIPADAVEISDAEHSALMAGQSVGKRIQADANGRPVLVDRPAPTLAATVAEALATIDAEAGRARARYITVAPGQEATYMLKEAHARAYKAAGYVGDYAMVSAEAKAVNGDKPTATQIKAAADTIVAQADAWIVLASQIERQRIAGKIAVAAAVDVAAVTVAAELAILELQAL